MFLPPTIKREIQVAFAKDAQPIWFRIVKYILLGAMFYFLWGTRLLWVILAALFVFGAALHFWFRYKTHAWTKTYGPWKHEKDKDSKERNDLI